MLFWFVNPQVVFAVDRYNGVAVFNRDTAVKSKCYISLFGHQTYSEFFYLIQDVAHLSLSQSFHPGNVFKLIAVKS